MRTGDVLRVALYIELFHELDDLLLSGPDPVRTQIEYILGSVGGGDLRGEGPAAHAIAALEHQHVDACMCEISFKILRRLEDEQGNLPGQRFFRRCAALMPLRPAPMTITSWIAFDGDIVVVVFVILVVLVVRVTLLLASGFSRSSDAAVSPSPSEFAPTAAPRKYKSTRTLLKHNYAYLSCSAASRAGPAACSPKRSWSSPAWRWTWADWG